MKITQQQLIVIINIKDQELIPSLLCILSIKNKKIQITKSSILYKRVQGSDDDIK